MVEKITEEETRQLQHLVFTVQSRSEQFISLIPTQQDANESLLNYLKGLTVKYNCDYKEIMGNGEIVRLKDLHP